MSRHPRPGRTTPSADTRRRGGRGPRVAGEPQAQEQPRIIGGTLRGRRLPFEPGGPTRPMKDRVRETLFDLVGPAVSGSLAIDLFAGTGALGFEALSRGAVGAVFAERHFPTADRLRRAAAELGVADRVEVRPGDSLLWPLRMPTLDRSRPWIVFVSPPWSFFRERLAETMALVTAMAESAPAGSRIAVEADGSFDAASLPWPAEWAARPMPPAVLYLRSSP